MINNFKDVLNHFFVITLLMTSNNLFKLVCVLNITFVKIAYWVSSLLLLYYSFAYNCEKYF